jgi:hypothetical protein
VKTKQQKNGPLPNKEVPKREKISLVDGNNNCPSVAITCVCITPPPQTFFKVGPAEKE